MADLEVIVLGTDNSIDLALTEDGHVISSDFVSQVKVTLEPKQPGSVVMVDSGVTPAAFILDEDEEIGGEQIRVIKLKFGMEAITAGKYDAFLVTVDGGHPNGIFWGQFPVEVVAIPS